MKRKVFCAALGIVFAAAFAFFVSSVQAEKITLPTAFPLTHSQTTVAEDGIQDGPYVFWNGERVHALYICQGQKVEQTFDARDSIQIPGFCNDSPLILTLTEAPPLPEPDTFDAASKICAVSDIHGNFKQMIRLLQENGIINDRNRWKWSDGHLIIVGDVFDRGEEVTEALWFIHQLEKEAHRERGRVTFVLGNHEIMVLKGDLRYVHPKYQAVSRKLKIKIPDLYGPESELGRWLRSKNVMVKINDILFVHGGISSELTSRAYSLHSINEMIRNSLDARDYTVQFNEELNLLYGNKGPLWYRGLVTESQGIPLAGEEEVNRFLAFYKANAVITGHTIVPTITPSFGGRVYAIETGICEGSEGEVLVWEKGQFYRGDVHGRREKLK
ncbi:MAG: metallophosphoesterase [Candidatus Aminicenantales bacterium]